MRHHHQILLSSLLLLLLLPLHHSFSHRDNTAFIPFSSSTRHAHRQTHPPAAAAAATTTTTTTTAAAPSTLTPPIETLTLDTPTIQHLWGVDQVKALSPEEWTAAAEAHRRRILTLFGGSTKHNTDNPIQNFIFEYYHFKPPSLLDFSLGLEPAVCLLEEGGEVRYRTSRRIYTEEEEEAMLHREEEAAVREGEGKGKREMLEEIRAKKRLLAPKAHIVTLPTHQHTHTHTQQQQALAWLPPTASNPHPFNNKHLNALRYAHQVLRTTINNPPHFSCYGTHEWAMLYHPPSSSQPPPFKYQSLPLRIDQATLNAHVESRPITCTHYDAFRFFTPDARPLNVYAQDLDTRKGGQLLHEQPGCLHANMDLFKWGIKMGVYVPSDLLADTLELAIRSRVCDMRASPYDLYALNAAGGGGGKGGGGGGKVKERKRAQTSQTYTQTQTDKFGGYEMRPIKIETEEGRKEYQWEQMRLYEFARPLRERLLRVYEGFFSGVGEEGGEGGGE